MHDWGHSFRADLDSHVITPKDVENLFLVTVK